MRPIEKTLIDEANEQRWGPTIEEPTDAIHALEYALMCLGDRSRPASLGEVYSIKMLLWLKEKLKREQASR